MMIRRLFKRDPLVVSFSVGFIASATAWLVTMALIVWSLMFESFDSMDLWFSVFGGATHILWLLTGSVALPTFPWCIIQAMRAQRRHKKLVLASYVALANLSLIVASAVILLNATIVGYTT